VVKAGFAERPIFRQAHLAYCGHGDSTHEPGSAQRGATCQACARNCGGTDERAGTNRANEKQGPLDLGSTSGTTCVAGIQSQHFTLGTDLVRSVGDTEIELSSLALVESTGLVLNEAYLVPVDEALVGSWSQFPPPSRVTDGPELQWDARAEVTGASVEPGLTYNLVVHLEATQPGTEASVDGLRVAYQSAGKSYTGMTPTAFETRENC
jgi:hypothetical protein